MILELSKWIYQLQKGYAEVEEDNANILQTIETALQKKSVCMSFFR